MRYLLDTHVWLWLAARPERIQPDVLAELQRASTQLLFSAATSWEIAIKWTLGRLPLPEPPAMYVPERIRQFNAIGMAIEHAHALQVATLPRHHRDPFDRLLIAQAQLESLPIVTADPEFDAYDVEVVRATV
ncbi:MAG: type II toxin-antitoxin system VapC family toxin [Chloroflexota bacterium]